MRGKDGAQPRWQGFIGLKLGLHLWSKQDGVRCTMIKRNVEMVVVTFSVVSMTRPWQAAWTSQVGFMEAFQPGRIWSRSCFTRSVL